MPSQVVLTEIQTSSIGSCHIGQQVVAKFFDPLFVSVGLPGDDAPQKYRQLVAYRFCEREGAAYSTLSALQGTSIPIFYGQFECHFHSRPTESDQTVKVILMEHIDGWPLSWYSPDEMTESLGQWIPLSRGRNEQARVVLVDFEESEILNEKSRYSPEVMKEEDFIVLRCEFEDFGLIPRSNLILEDLAYRSLNVGLVNGACFERLDCRALHWISKQMMMFYSRPNRCSLVKERVTELTIPT
ncbi:hypothetical protein V1515DRAFT_631218 [Lipomyces mesembrius]